MILSMVLLLALSSADVDIITLPPTNEVRVPLNPPGRADLKREGTVTRIRIEIDRVSPPSSMGPVFYTYVVWAVTPEGVFDNLGELDQNGVKGQFNGTTRLTEFGVLVTAEPHYMVDRPSSAVAFRSQTVQDPRRKTAAISVGAYDYSKLKPISATGVHGSVTQARMAFQIAQNVGADHLAPQEFRNAQVALNSLEELVMRFAPFDILWPTANEAIRWAERAAEVSRQPR
jgi:hypothetical protein